MTDLETLILTTDPKDKAACDELNARFWCYIKGHYFVKMCITSSFEFEPIIADGRFRYPKPPVEYTHSLDALKAEQDAELEGWENCCTFGGVYSNMDMWRPDSLQPDHRYAVTVQSKDLPTMELAWMHAIYQAIKWKRENEDV